MDWIALCPLQALPDGSARGFDPYDEQRDTVFVVRIGDAVYGYRNACPHVEGAPMAWRKDAYMNASRTHIVCHGHGAQFDIHSGICVSGPCLGQALTPLLLQITKDGIVKLASQEPNRLTDDAQPRPDGELRRHMCP